MKQIFHMIWPLASCQSLALHSPILFKIEKQQTLQFIKLTRQVCLFIQSMKTLKSAIHLNRCPSDYRSQLTQLNLLKQINQQFESNEMNENEYSNMAYEAYLLTPANILKHSKDFEKVYMCIYKIFYKICSSPKGPSFVHRYEDIILWLDTDLSFHNNWKKKKAQKASLINISCYQSQHSKYKNE